MDGLADDNQGILLCYFLDNKIEFIDLDPNFANAQVFYMGMTVLPIFTLIKMIICCLFLI